MSTFWKLGLVAGTLVLAAGMSGVITTAIALERGVTKVPAPILAYARAPYVPGYVDPALVETAPTQLGACSSPIRRNTYRPGGSMHHNSITLDNTTYAVNFLNKKGVNESHFYGCLPQHFVPLETLIESTVDGFAKWLAEDRAAQINVVTRDIEVQAKIIDSLRGRINALEERLRKLEKE